MRLPHPIAPITISGLKAPNPSPQGIYEAAKATVDAHNQLISYLSPGDTVTAASFSTSQGVSITALSGTFKRGKFTATIRPDVVTNPNISLIFTSGLFSDQPFATVVRNGGTGTLGFTYQESPSQMMITLSGHPVAGSTYTFQWAIQG